MRRSGMLLAGVVTAVACAPAAQAGTYSVFSCKKPDGTPAPTDGWAPVDGAVPAAPATRSAAGCQSGGPIRVELASGTDHTPGTGSDYAFKAAAGLPIVGYVLYRSAHVGASTPPEQYNYDLLEDGEVSPENCRGGCDRGVPSAPLSESSAYARSNVRLSELRFRVSCAAGSPDTNTCHGQTPSPSSVAINRAEVILEDPSDPEFTSPPSGTLFDTGRELSGVVSASFAARDQGSGVYRVVIEVDGNPVVSAPVDDNDGRCARPFLQRVPCRAGVSVAGTVSLDTAVLPDGRHNVRLLVQDATQTNAIPYGPVAITTRNSVPGRGAPNGTNAADGAVLAAAWKGRRARSIVSRFGRTAVVAGTLRNPAGQSIVGATIDLFKRDLRLGAPEVRVGTVTTGPDGTWGHRFRSGPGTTLTARYRAFAGDVAPTAQQSLTLRVPAAVTMKAPRQVRRGSRLRFSGRLRGGPIPRSGKLVSFQALAGRHWQGSDLIRTDRRGRFKGSVPVRRGGGRQTVKVRILVRAEPSYPYSLGTSPVRRVTLVP